MLDHNLARKGQCNHGVIALNIAVTITLAIILTRAANPFGFYVMNGIMNPMHINGSSLRMQRGKTSPTVATHPSITSIWIQKSHERDFIRTTLSCPKHTIRPYTCVAITQKRCPLSKSLHPTILLIRQCLWQ